MVKSNKKRQIKNKTKKNLKSDLQCPISLKPFQEEFSKNLPSSALVKSNEQKTREFVKELMTKFAPSDIKPENNFYDYINYLWLKNVSLKQQQSYIVQVDDFRLVQDKVYQELNQIILDYIKTHNDKLSTNLKNFYNSVVNMNSKTETRKLAKEAVQMIEKFTLDKNGVWKLLAFVNSDEMIAYSAPFVWSLNPDDKNSKIYRCYLTPHQFTILDINVYFDDGKDEDYKKKISCGIYKIKSKNI